MQQSIHMTKSSKYCKCTRTLEWEDKYLATRYVSNLGTITCFSEHGMIDMCFCSNEANSCQRWLSFWRYFGAKSLFENVCELFVGETETKN